MVPGKKGRIKKKKKKRVRTAGGQVRWVNKRCKRVRQRDGEREREKGNKREAEGENDSEVKLFLECTFA